MKRRDGYRGIRSHLFKTRRGEAFNAYAHHWMRGLRKWYNRRLRPAAAARR